MYLTVSCWFPKIFTALEGGGGSAVRTPYNTPLYSVNVTHGLVYIITIYAPMIYTAPCVMIFMRAASITRASGRDSDLI
jgi:hypothetical protein